MATHRASTTRSRVLMVGTLLVLLVWTLVLALLIGWLLVTCSSALAAAPGANAGEPPPLRVTSYNTLRTRPAAPVHAELVRLSRVSDVIVAQETPARRARGVPGFRTLAWGGLGTNRPILYRSARFALEAYGRRLAQWHPYPRGFTFARLLDRATGARVTIVNYHGLPHVERGGHPRRLWRVGAYSRSTHRLGAFLARVHGRVIVGGDWNVNHWTDARVRWYGFPAAMAARGGLDVRAPRAGTLGNRTVDYELTRGRWTSSAIVHRSGFGSDHRPVTVTYRAPTR